jgi:hypothetical protein
MVNAVRGFGDPIGLHLSQALKEWAIAIDALSSGELILLLRKGGIRDPAQPFARPPHAVALFPTTEHQVPDLLKQLEVMDPDADQEYIQLKAWAQITHQFALRSPSEIEVLMPFHIWTDRFIAERLKWRPQQPIQVLCLRTYRLPEPVQLVRSPLYKGCRSWVPLETPILVERHSPVLTNQAYYARLKAIEAALQMTSPFSLAAYQIRTEAKA